MGERKSELGVNKIVALRKKKEANNIRKEKN